MAARLNRPNIGAPVKNNAAPVNNNVPIANNPAGRGNNANPDPNNAANFIAPVAPAGRGVPQPNGPFGGAAIVVPGGRGTPQPNIRRADITPGVPAGRGVPPLNNPAGGAAPVLPAGRGVPPQNNPAGGAAPVAPTEKGNVQPGGRRAGVPPVPPAGRGNNPAPVPVNPAAPNNPVAKGKNEVTPQRNNAAVPVAAGDAAQPAPPPNVPTPRVFGRPNKLPVLPGGTWSKVCSGGMIPILPANMGFEPLAGAKPSDATSIQDLIIIIRFENILREQPQLKILNPNKHGQFCIALDKTCDAATTLTIPSGAFGFAPDVISTGLVARDSVPPDPGMGLCAGNSYSCWYLTRKIVIPLDPTDGGKRIYLPLVQMGLRYPASVDRIKLKWTLYHCSYDKKEPWGPQSDVVPNKNVREGGEKFVPGVSENKNFEERQLAYTKSDAAGRAWDIENPMAGYPAEGQVRSDRPETGPVPVKGVPALPGLIGRPREDVNAREGLNERAIKENSAYVNAKEAANRADAAGGYVQPPDHDLEGYLNAIHNHPDPASVKPGPWAKGDEPKPYNGKEEKSPEELARDEADEARARDLRNYYGPGRGGGGGKESDPGNFYAP